MHNSPPDSVLRSARGIMEGAWKILDKYMRDSVVGKWQRSVGLFARSWFDGLLGNTVHPAFNIHVSFSKFGERPHDHRLASYWTFIHVSHLGSMRKCQPE